MTGRNQRVVEAEGQAVEEGVGSEQLELVGAVVGQEPVLALGQTNVIVQDRRAGIRLAVIRQHGAFIVTDRFGKSIRTLQAPHAIVSAFERRLERQVLAPCLRHTDFSRIERQDRAAAVREFFADQERQVLAGVGDQILVVAVELSVTCRELSA